MTRSQLACRFSLDDLAEIALCHARETAWHEDWRGNRKRNRDWKKCLYLWTFTFPDLLPLHIAVRMWNHMLTILRRAYPDLIGVRVFEMHRHHGLHIHMVCTRRIEVDAVRRLAHLSGFGRIHVKRIHADQVHYIAKYLGKQARHPAFRKGSRLNIYGEPELDPSGREIPQGARQAWAAFGKWDKTRIKDVHFDTPWTRAYAAIKKAVPDFGRLAFRLRKWAVNIHILGNWGGEHDYEDRALNFASVLCSHLPPPGQPPPLDNGLELRPRLDLIAPILAKQNTGSRPLTWSGQGELMPLEFAPV
jgi:hypothetical protein